MPDRALLPRRLAAHGGDPRQVPGAHRGGARARAASPTPRAEGRAHLRARARGSRRRTGSREDSADVKKGNNHWTRAELRPAKAPGLDWSAFFAAAGLARPAASSSCGSRAPSPASRRSSASEPLDDLEGLPDLPRHRALARRCCPRRFVEERFAFYGTVLRGHAEAARPLEARGRRDRATRSARPSASSTSRSYFPPAEKARAEAMVQNLIAAFGAPHRRARLDGAGDQGARPRPSSPCSRSASAIPTSGATTPASRSCAATRSATRSAPALFEYRRNLAQARPAGGPRRVGDEPADRQRGEPAGDERAELPGRDPAAALLRSRAAGGDGLRRDRAPSSATRSATASTTRARCSTPSGRLRNWWTPEDFAHFDGVRRPSWSRSTTPTSRSPTSPSTAS